MVVFALEKVLAAILYLTLSICVLFFVVVIAELAVELLLFAELAVNLLLLNKLAMCFVLFLMDIRLLHEYGQFFEVSTPSGHSMIDVL